MRCLICKGQKVEKIILINEISRYTKKKYPLFKCLNCGFIRPNPLPYDETTKMNIYDEEENIKFYDKKSKKIEKQSKEYNYYFKHFIPYIKFIKEYSIKGSALDIGCGAGHLIALLKKEGINAEGFEITKKLVNALKKEHKIHSGNLKKIIASKKKYDLITFNQVIEHIIYPEKFISEINKLTKKGGYIIFAVPYIYGVVPIVLRSKWYGLGYGQHLNFFSKKSVAMLLERNGFETKKIDILIVDYAHPKFPEALNILIRMIMKLIVKFKLGDNMFVVAQKTSEIK